VEVKGINVKDILRIHKNKMYLITVYIETENEIEHGISFRGEMKCSFNVTASNYPK